MATRKYTQTRRAERQAETHRRIVQATMELHEELGAARTTISAVAERAGVQRLTVYRHFPDEAALLMACTSRWLELNPPPGPDAWSALEDPVQRARAALLAFHAYYRETEPMWEGAYRDRELVPALDERMEVVESYLDGLTEELVRGLKLRGKRRERARVVLRHGIRFSTWRSLSALGLSDETSAELVGDWLEATLAPAR